MKILNLFITFVFFLSFLFSPEIGTNQSVSAQSVGCAINSPSSNNYSIEFCITSPTHGSSHAGDINITTSFSSTGSSPGIQRVIFYLNNEYLLTDFENAYSFIIPSHKFADGTYNLSVTLVMRDGYVFQMGSINIQFNNGNATTPVNTNSFQIFTSPEPTNGQPFKVIAGGDGASGITNALNVTNRINSLDPDMFLYLGDVYNKGTITEFYNWYGNDQTFFGQFRSITNPIVGNHEYENGVAPGYFDYWDNIPEYYSYDSGGWHFIALNSYYSVTPVDPSSDQYQWLQQDLASNNDTCTVAYFHHPLFNIGPPSSTTELMDMWNLMVQAGVDIVLTGHDHTYQRWMPLGVDGQPDPNGAVQFVAGASGHGVQTISKSDARVAFSSDANPGALGALVLDLNADGANYSYVNVAGEVIDSGIIACTGADLDTQPPTTPGNFSASIVSATQVDLSWNVATDNTGIVGYTIYRDDIEIGNVSPGTTSFSDYSLLPQTTYSFSVDAYDLVGNHSGKSNAIIVNTPPLPSTLTFQVNADTYVNEGSPNSSYGSAVTIRMDATPDLHSYLRFNVHGLAGNPISTARLQIFTKSNSSLGITARQVLNNAWDEYTMKYVNAPALGDPLGSSGPITADTWITYDVTPYITGEGLYSFGLTTNSSTALTVSSRESGLNSALLVIDFENNGADISAPTAPTNLSSISRTNPFRVDLAWAPSTDNVGVTGYHINRNGQLLGTVSGNILAFSDTTISPQTEYSYTVSAFDLAGNNSNESNQSITITPENQPPSTPTNLTGVVTGSGFVNLNWTPSTDNVGVAGYTLYRNGAVLLTLDGSLNSYEDTTVLPGNLYTYTIDAFDAAGNRSPVSEQFEINILDTQAPSTPSSLMATIVSATQVDLSWNASSDNVGVTGYTIYRNGLLLEAISGVVLSYSDVSASPNTTYDYSIDAFDLAGNHSALTSFESVTTPDVPSTLAFTPVADAYVDASKPTINYGSSTIMRADASPDLHGYLKFNIQGLGQKSISKAQLFVYTNSNSSKGIRILGVENNSWVENTIRYNNSPPLGNVLASSGSIQVGTWVVFDVTSYVSGEGEISFGLDTTSSTSVSLASRESNANSPYLVLDLFTFVPDITPPSTPTGLSVNPVSSTQVDLTWNTSSDDIGIGGYTIYRDGSMIDTVPDSSLEYSDSNVIPNTEYTYSIDAFDLSENHSGISSSVNVITPDVPSIMTFTPAADAYVDAGKPNNNYGSSTTLRADASPDLHSYLRFNVQNLFGKSVSQARLLVFANSRTSSGINILRVPDNNWAENTIRYNNAPVLGDFIVASNSFSAGTWISLDVTSFVNGEGTFSFGLTTPSSSSINFASRESGANAPQLVLDLYTAVPDATPPSTPTGLTATPISPTQVDLQWSAVTDDVGVNEYKIYRDGFVVATVSGTTLLFSDTTVSALSSYAYSVVAVDEAGNQSPSSTEVFVNTGENEPPSTPVGLTAEVIGSNLVRLSWNASTDNVGVTGYSLYRDGSLLAEVDSSILLYEDTTVSNGGSYTYTVAGFDLAGNYSPQSAPIEVTINFVDTESPSIPSDLSASASSPTSVNLSWSASTDNVGVSGYTIFRDGSIIASVDAPSLSYSDTTATPNTVYSYSVDAFDASGNHSAESNSAETTTPDVPSSLTFLPTADAYVNESSPNSNYGTSTTLRVDASPVLNSYLKFSVQGLHGNTITRARLLIYANSSSSQVLQALAVSDNNWNEGSITFSNAPLMGDILGTSSPVVGGNWIELDITGSINAEGEFSFGVTTPGLTAVGLASRENLDFASQLIIDLD